MLQKLKILIRAALITLSVMSPLVFAVPAHAQLFPNSKEEACKGANLQNTACNPGQTADAQLRINSVIAAAINILSLIVGVISVIMIIVGGLKYITSAGDSSGVNSAKNTILYAIIGLAVTAMAQIIVRFVLGRILGTPAPPAT